MRVSNINSFVFCFWFRWSRALPQTVRRNRPTDTVNNRTITSTATACPGPIWCTGPRPVRTDRRRRRHCRHRRRRPRRRQRRQRGTAAAAIVCTTAQRSLLATILLKNAQNNYIFIHSTYDYVSLCSHTLSWTLYIYIVRTIRMFISLSFFISFLLYYY